MQQEDEFLQAQCTTPPSYCTTRMSHNYAMITRKTTLLKFLTVQCTKKIKMANNHNESIYTGQNHLVDLAG
jgi:hypothetical protein